MNKPLAIVLVAAALLAVPVGYGAVQGAHLLASHNAAAPPPSTTDTKGSVLKEWTGDVAADILKGSLDVRTFRGNVHVLGWDQETYLIQVLASKADPNGVTLGQRDITADLKAEVKDGTQTWLLTVNAQGNAVRINQDNEVAVLAKVPARLAYDVKVCSGTGVSFTVAGDGQDGGCTQQQGADLNLNLNPMKDANSSARLDVPFLVEGLHGASLSLTANEAALATKAIRFDQAQLVSNNGAIAFDGDAAQVGLISNNGAIDATLRNTLSGKAAIESNNGAVKVHVPLAQDRGYQVDATTNNGRVTIDLPDMDVQGNSSGQQQGSDAGLLGLVPLAKPPSDPHQQSQQGTVHAQSKNLAQDSVVTALGVVTNNGDILVDGIGAAAKDK